MNASSYHTSTSCGCMRKTVTFFLYGDHKYSDFEDFRQHVQAICCGYIAQWLRMRDIFVYTYIKSFRNKKKYFPRQAQPTCLLST